MFDQEDDLLNPATETEGERFLALDFAIRFAESVNASPAAHSPVTPDEVVATAQTFLNFVSGK